jgi:hypothetical protein
MSTQPSVTRNGKTFEVSGSNALQPQTISNAPEVDDTSYSLFELGNQVRGTESYGSTHITTNRAGQSTVWIFIANDVTAAQITVNNKQITISARELKQRTYVHELGNYLSGVLTNNLRYFGDPNGIKHEGDLSADPDFDTGANLENCVWGNMRP